MHAVGVAEQFVYSSRSDSSGNGCDNGDISGFLCGSGDERKDNRGGSGNISCFVVVVM